MKAKHKKQYIFIEKTQTHEGLHSVVEAELMIIPMSLFYFRVSKERICYNKEKRIISCQTAS